MEADNLRRRVHLGLDLGPDVEGAPAGAGALVRAVHVGGPAEGAGVRVGDRITRVGEVDVTHPADVASATREVVEGAPVRLGLVREDVSTEVDVTPRLRPVESIEGGRVVLGSVVVGSTRLRTILTLPHGAGPWPCVLYLQGIDVGSCEFPLDASAPLRRLVFDWTRAGFATMRVERSGVGDSEGPPPEETDLDAEIRAAVEALQSIARVDEIDPASVFLFGHSVGGMIAPVVASHGRVRGVVTFGTSARRWRTSAVSTTERQLALKGFVGEQLSARLAAWAEMHAAVCRDGLTPAEAIARRPHLSVLASRQCGGAALFGHHARFFRQLDALGVAAAWSALSIPVLVLHGEHDWVCDRSDADSVAAAVRSSGRLEQLDGVGHDMRSHASLEASFHRPREGAWEGRTSAASAAWMRGLSRQTD